MSTTPIRVPERVHQEVKTAARVLGCSASALLEQAWMTYSRSPDFVLQFGRAQESLSEGHVEAVTSRLLQEEEIRDDRNVMGGMFALRRNPDDVEVHE